MSSASTNSNTRKILEISSYPPPRAGWGIRVSFVKEEIIRRGHVCEVLNISPFSRKISSQEYLPTRNGLDYVWKVLSRCLRGYRVHMHLNGDSPKGIILAMLAESISLLTFKRPVLTFHAGPYQKYFPQERSSLLAPAYKYIFKMAGKIICNNGVVKEKIVGYGINPEKIVPIQAFSIQYMNYLPVPLSDELKDFLNTRRPRIITYAFFRPEYFLDRMVKAISRVIESYPDLGLLFVGHDANSDSIRVLIRELGIERNVFFAGDQSHDSFLSILKEGDFYLRTHYKDGVSSSVLEALYLGVPVIASENNSRPAGVITYENNNIDDMVKVITESIQNLEDIKSSLPRPHIWDTVTEEVDLLLDYGNNDGRLVSK